MVRPNRILQIVFTLFLICTLLPVSAFAEVDVVRPGLIIDADNSKMETVVAMLRKELTDLLPGKVRFVEPFVMSSGWDVGQAKKNYQYFLDQEEINLIISFGVLSTGAVVENQVFPKPVIAVGVVDTDLQAMPPPTGNSSGISNLTYVLFNKSVKRDIQAFYDVYPFTRLAIVVDQHILNAIVRNPRPALQALTEEKATVSFVPLTTDIKEILDRTSEFDAVYLGHLGRFEGADKKRLINALTGKGIPCFGASLDDIDSGVLAALSPEESIVKVIRRIALNTEALLQGTPLSELPVRIDFQEQLTINMMAANKIGFSPRFTTLTKADVVNELRTDEDKMLSYEAVIQEALKENAGLAISRFDIEIAREDLQLSRADYYPSLTANATETVIDQDYARQLQGSQAEWTTLGNLKIEQLLFSEDLNASVDIYANSLTAATEAFQADRLDAIYTATSAYFDILKAKTLAQIRKKDLVLTRKHLAIAEQRQSAGYSGMADVYRWKSSIATGTSDLLQAINSFRLSKIQLNQVLNRPLDQNVSIRDESIKGELFRHYSHKKGYDFIDNPAALHQFTDFLVAEALLHSPEIKELEANGKALDRRLLNTRRKRYIPVAALSGEANHIFDRSGEGADIPGVDPEDNWWTVSANLSWPLYQGGAIRTQRARVQQEILKLQRQKNQLVQQLELKVRAAVLDLENRVINLESSEKSADFAQKRLVIVQDSYAKGQVSITDLINAQSEALATNLNSLNSAYEYLVSVFNMERATGRFSLFSSPEEITAYRSRMHSFMEKAKN